MSFIKLEEVESLDENTINKLYKRHYSNVFYNYFKYMGIDKNFCSAKGMYVYDKEEKYLDFLGGFGALNLGHNDKRLLKVIEKYSYRPNMLQISKNTFAAVLANNISEITNDEFTYSFFTNSGTETIEEAIKLAFLYNKRGNIIYCKGAYHGKTLGAISALGTKEKEKYGTLFNFIEVDFGDIGQIEYEVENNNVAAILIEPIQGEGGIRVGSSGYFKEIRKICDKEDIILIFDEIQTGLGRCGTMFCYENIGVVPDILCISKSLSGGIIPIGAMCVESTLWDDTYGRNKYGTLIGNTFSGNTLAMAVGIKVLEIIKKEELPKRAEYLGKYAMELLTNLKDKYKIIKEVRGKGLMIGIEFCDGKGIMPSHVMQLIMSNIVSELMNKYNIISGFTINNPSVLRVEPPLIVTKEQIEYFVKSLDMVLEKQKRISSMSINAFKNVGGNLLKV